MFLLKFWGIVLVLYILRCLFPSIAGQVEQDVKELANAPLQHVRHHHSNNPFADEDIPDSIKDASRRVDEYLRCPREELILFTPDGQHVRHPINDSLDYANIFSDGQDVHIATAALIGQPECEDREEAMTHSERYVYVGASPYYDIENLTHSVPYLIPRAAILLEEIGHAFLDSLAAKDIPAHKLVVTSVLRTNADVKRLQRRNRNAVEQSCHLFGTTFDIAYNGFHSLNDDPTKRGPVENTSRLRAVLAEVLNDQRNIGTCYVKYESHEHCFHITCR